MSPSYHDLYITTRHFDRTSIFNLYYSVKILCTRTAGWECWEFLNGVSRLLGSEYGNPEDWLILDVNGHVIVDSRNREE